MRIEEVEVQLIKPDIHRRRPINEVVVKELADSIKREGLLHPITLRLDGDHLRLVAGAHRLEAVAFILGWDTIPAIIADLSDDEAEVIEIEENLVRADLTREQRDTQIRRIAELIKVGQNDPVSSRGGRGRLGLALHIAQRLGLQKKTVQRALAGGKHYLRNKKPEPPKEPEAPSPSIMMDQAMAIIQECWTDVADGYRASIKATIAALPGGDDFLSAPFIAPWEIEDMATRMERHDAAKLTGKIQLMVAHSIAQQEVGPQTLNRPLP